MTKYFSVKKNTNYTLTVSKSGYTTHTETINISADTTKNVTLTPDFTPETVRFDYTGAVQTFTVPQGCTKLIVDCVGAAGGGGINYGSSLVAGGKGGRVQCKLSVTEGQTLNIYVGGKGINGKILSANGLEIHDGGYNGGGKGGSMYVKVLSNVTAFGGGSGGGASDIRINGTSLNNRIIVAGAGGGTIADSTYKGGDGGGLIGMNGYPSSSSSYTNPTGGTQSSGGSGAKKKLVSSTVQGENGTLGVGGNGCSTSAEMIGSGAGGGYYGGGGGCTSGGAGGSSYTDSTLCSNVTHTQGYSSATGNGWIIITTSNE